MTALTLLSDLKEEIEVLLKDVVTKNTAGEPVTGVKGYEYRLPIIVSDEEDESQPLCTRPRSLLLSQP